MGKKSNYFRHTFDAHNDDKIINLIELGGLKCVGFYFILLEIYGGYINSDDEGKPKQKIPIRRLANATGLRADSCRNAIKLLSECELIEALWINSPITSIELEVPNFAKYFGKYSKAEHMKSPNKRKEKERKEIKENDFDFKSIFENYPRKKGEASGMEICRETIKSETDFNDLATAINNYNNECSREDTEAKYMLHFSTFMTNNKWREYIKTDDNTYGSHLSPDLRLALLNGPPPGM